MGDTVYNILFLGGAIFTGLLVGGTILTLIWGKEIWRPLRKSKVDKQV